MDRWEEERFNCFLSSCRWTPVAHMLTPRMNLGVGAIRDMRDAVTGVSFNAIYAIGGYSGKSILGTAEKYDIQLDTWTEIAPMKTPRRNVGEQLQYKPEGELMREFISTSKHCRGLLLSLD